MKKFVRILGLLAVVGMLAAPAALADGHANCGGKYNASLEVQQVDLSNPATGPLAVSYCSDGTLDETGAPGADGPQPSECGTGTYPATAEWDTGQLPEPSPFMQAWGCSDNTLDELQNPPV